MVEAQIHPSVAIAGAHFDVIICGSGSSGSVLARRLSDQPDLRVLLLEAGGDEYTDSMRESGRWLENLGGPHDWAVMSEPDEELNGRSLMLSTGKVLGGSASINAMIWARGHRTDWDFFASEAGDDAWNYESVSRLYQVVEDYQGAQEPRRGRGGLVHVAHSSTPSRLAAALVEAAQTVGIPSFESPNGSLMESAQGAAVSDLTIRKGKRQSVFKAYALPILGRSNLTVVTGAAVHRVIIDGAKAVGVDVMIDGVPARINASQHVVLSTGAINTPKILMHSGIGDETELKRVGIPLVQHLPGVGRNLQDHLNFSVVWESPTPIQMEDNGSAAMVFATSDATLTSPDIVMCQAEGPFCNPELLKGAGYRWSLIPGLARPKSRGRVTLCSDNPGDTAVVTVNALSHPDDRATAKSAVSICQEIGRAEVLKPHVNRENLPGDDNADLDAYIRRNAMPFFHHSCTAKMGRDDMSVVDGNLGVYGVSNLMIADGSIMPRITTGNTMAPCVIIGERAAQILEARFGLGKAGIL